MDIGRYHGGPAVSLGTDQALFWRHHGHARIVDHPGIYRRGTERRQEGRAGEARRIILRLGGIRLGEAGDAVVSRLDAISDLEKLEQLGDRLLIASSWDQLLGQEES